MEVLGLFFFNFFYNSENVLTNLQEPERSGNFVDNAENNTFSPYQQTQKIDI